MTVRVCDPAKALELSQARELALREVLSVIARSRDDEGPVFEVILERACRFCETPFAGLYLLGEDGQAIRLAASLGARTDYLKAGEHVWPIDDPASVPRAIREGSVVQVADLLDTDVYRQGNPERVAAVDVEGIRTFLAVPLMLRGAAIGCIGLYRREVAPFEASQIALVEAFSEQAVIAIENVRQFRELQTRLEREEAMREILHVISRSRDKEEPVFEAVLRNALRLCNAEGSVLLLGRPDDPHLRLAAFHVAETLSAVDYAPIVDEIGQMPMRMDPSEHFAAEAICSGRVVQIEDVAQSAAYLSGESTLRVMVDKIGVHAMVSVPLVDTHGPLGAINLCRLSTQAFTDDEILLVESFAAQAVIAIENVRQFRELQARLEREKATSEVLEQISMNRDDEGPVFDTILRNAVRLCSAPHALVLMRNEEDTQLHLVAHNSVSESFVERIEAQPFDLADDNTYAVRAIRTCELQHVADISVPGPIRTPAYQMRMAA